MSIPDRFYRIAKHKLGEMKEWFDKVDEEEDTEAQFQRRRADSRADARRELNDTLATPGASGNGAAGTSRNATSGTPSSSVPLNPPRSPQDIARGARPVPSYNSPSNNNASSTTSGNTPSGYGSNGTAANITSPDPLDYHYKLLGLEPGVEFSGVQSAYNKLAARCDPARFPAGSREEQQAREIRERLDASFKKLRDVLDSTSTRFGLLEF